MKELDVKLLWGRSGFRCANCKVELTANGPEDTIGEMAHIIAKSNDGPRGESDLTPQQRDEYSNLILLCPTCHRVIDKKPIVEWTIERLKKMKSEHENLIAERLSLASNQVDNSDFLKSRRQKWLEVAQNRVWVIFSLTPLKILNDSIDPTTPEFRQLINDLTYINCENFKKYDMNTTSSINKSFTRSNEDGLLNNNSTNLKAGVGYRVQIFRNGYCEFMVCFEDCTSQAKIRGGYRKCFFYTKLVNCFQNQIRGLTGIWRKGLPYKDMLATLAIAGADSTCLLSGEKDPIYSYDVGAGYPVESNMLEAEQVINREDNDELLIEFFAKRFVHYYGFDINESFPQ